MPEGGELRIGAEQVRDRLLIRVEDSGVGIPPTDLPLVLDPFFTTKPNGSGLGFQSVGQSCGIWVARSGLKA
jgi:signal transduction histidine kinase